MLCSCSSHPSLGALRQHILVEHLRIQPDAPFPRHRRGLGIHDDLLELTHVAPKLEGADLEEVSEKHAALQPVVETQPELVVVFRLARSYSMHLDFLPLPGPLGRTP